MSSPSSLRAIRLGDAFNFPVEQSCFPRLHLGDAFDHAVEGVLFSPLIDTLTFGYQFNHPVARVSWPERLREMRKAKENNCLALALVSDLTCATCFCSNLHRDR